MDRKKRSPNRFRNSHHVRTAISVIPDYRALTLRRTTPLIVVRLVYIFQAFNTSDRVFAEWRCAVVTQLTMNLSIIVACVPFLKTVINHLQPGWSTSNVRVGLGFKTIANLEANSRSGFAMGSVVRSD